MYNALIPSLTLALGARTHTLRYIQNLLDGEIVDVQESIENIKNRIIINPRNSSRLTWYMRINPTLSVHPAYNEKVNALNDLHRVAWTRLRLSAHFLASRHRGGALEQARTRPPPCGGETVPLRPGPI